MRSVIRNPGANDETFDLRCHWWATCFHQQMAAYDFIAVYIMASKRNGTLYLGVTSDLLQRVLDHREGRYSGFSAKYGCKLLV